MSRYFDWASRRWYFARVVSFVVETELQGDGMEFNGSVGLCIHFAPETCAQLRLGQSTIHLHLMAIAFECGELWTGVYVCEGECVWACVKSYKDKCILHLMSVGQREPG